MNDLSAVRPLAGELGGYIARIDPVDVTTPENRAAVRWHTPEDARKVEAHGDIVGEYLRIKELVRQRRGRFGVTPVVHACVFRRCDEPCTVIADSRDVSHVRDKDVMDQRPNVRDGHPELLRRDEPHRFVMRVVRSGGALTRSR